MEIMPYLWGGRFYNHNKDWISLRLSHAARCLLGKYLRKIFRKRYKCSFITPETWVEKADVPDRSREPLVTWIGHSTFLIQVGGFNILTDPVFFNVAMFAPRVLKAGVAIDKLPKIDFVIISHNHRDHMDICSIKRICTAHKPVILVPRGNKNWLERKKIINVFEKAWWEEQSFGDLKLTFLPASHWTSRGILDINTTLWGSWMVEYQGVKIYFAGDTAYGKHFEKIGKLFPEIDVALMPIGPVQPRKLIAEAHTCPVQAVKGFLDLNAKYFVPMHWGTFRSAYESFSAPVEVLLYSWEQQGEYLKDKYLKLLKAGESVKFG
jgi:L-ascorbate metabolism protein UlaG (beta-lactamase superfamily)